VANFYKSETSALEHVVPLVDMFKLSLNVSDEAGDYRHSELKAAIAGILVSNNKQFTIVISPTGSGKTWIQGLLAKYYCQQGKRVVVIEPNVQLMKQTAEKLAVIDYAITVTSIDRLYV
jgi:superfamily II DNA or RNA helicase